LEVNKARFYILLRFTAFIREAGYDEFALAIWQALIELHFFAPSMVSAIKMSDRLSSLEAFWESEVPRVGEENSAGWAGHSKTGEGAQRETQPPVDHKINKSTPLQSFATVESGLGRKFLLPASTYDDDAVEDPFRCVMFSDMHDILKPLSVDLPPLGLIECFVHFMGLPSISLHHSALDSNHCQKDAHLAFRHGQASATFEALRARDFAVSCRRETVLTYFNDAFDAFENTLQQMNAPENLIRFIDRVLGAVLFVDSSNETLAEYYIAFKARFLPNETAKVAKRILKQHSSSMRVYNAYALAEARTDLVKAMEIWPAALSLRNRAGIVRQEDAVYLWHSRLITQVNNGDDQGGLSLLLAMAGDIELDLSSEVHTRQLRVVRHLEEAFDRMQLSGRPTHAVLYADLLAWLSYLTMDHGINRPLQVYSKYSTKLLRSDLSLAAEQLHQCKARLIKMHIEQRRPHRPSLLQQELEISLTPFPNNSVLLELHASIATQDRIRSLVREQKAINTTMSPNVVQWSFKIAEEIRRSTHETSGSTSNTVRAVFSNALLKMDSDVSHSPALWTAWLHYEVGSAGSSRDPKAMQKAKRVFLDGLRYIPWVKSWVIHGMELLGNGILNHGELRQVYEVLNERGLRTRFDVEDLL
jgi:hypothetical protein